ncbi:MAG: hypothetical protein ACN6OB_10200, partial [Chryseobacterium jejuense]|uniref:hypothetical protein n=1 Tax=Chryseobacterium jejuense TaxID=445960 RepID=UPI003D0C86C5
SRPPPVFILFLKILYHYDKGFFFALYPNNKAHLIKKLKDIQSTTQSNENQNHAYSHLSLSFG